jgi:hypothetical protein
MNGKNGDPALTKEISGVWHQDGDHADEELKDLGIRVVMTLVGKPTMFSDDNPNIYQGDRVMGVNTQYINKIEEPKPGEIAVFNMVEKYAAAHAAPIVDAARLFVTFTSYFSPPVIYCEVETLQTIIEDKFYKTSEAIDFSGNHTYIDGL